MTAALHDPGGKVRFLIGSDTIGQAAFSPCERYRHSLTRKWGLDDGLTHGFALWIGMNPSVADGQTDDPTCRREVIYTRNRLKLSGYAKCNVMNYRATNPKALLAEGVQPCSIANSGYITDLAKRAKIVIAAWGALPKALRHHAEYVRQFLEQDGIELWCLGFTKDGSPRHPLYVRGDTELVRYPKEAADAR